jgi:two-component system response regulator (stage 0 sporulation protein F)
VSTSQDRSLVAVVCDDRADLRHVVGRLLARCGFTLGGTADGYLALRELVRATQPDVAVVTLPLPGMNGLRAVRGLHEAAPNCQIVLLSAFGQLDVAAVEAGAAALVPEDDLQALQIVLRGIAGAPRRVIGSLPDQRVQMAPPEATVSAATTVA